MTENNCQLCFHRKDLNTIIPWADPSRMFYNWKCFYGLDSSFDSVLPIYKENEGKDIPDLRYDPYNHKWITMGFKCPLEKS